MGEDIRVDVTAGIATVVIDRKDGRNALRPQSLRELCACLDAFAALGDVKALVLTSGGNHFSAGADFEFLKGLAETSAVDVKSQIYTAFQGAAKRLYRFPKPTIAAVHGAAITVGCELALACDFRLITSATIFQESWIKLGLLPPLGGLYLLPRIIGAGRAAEMALTGRAVAAEEALKIGLASELLATQAALNDRAREFAMQLATAAPLAYRAIKEALQRGLETSMDAEWSANVNAQSLLLGTQDFREGLAAVVERRAARFVGA